jgi:hypothetical protein
VLLFEVEIKIALGRGAEGLDIGWWGRGAIRKSRLPVDMLNGKRTLSD